MKKATYKRLAMNVFLCLFGLLLVYPLIWLFFASFKPQEEIFGSLRLLPTKYVFSSYANGWRGSGQVTFGYFFYNSFKLVVPTAAFTVLSSIMTGYGFARFEFPFKKILFALMIALLMLPNAVVIIPRYIMFSKIGWTDSYMPFIVPALFGSYSFFNYMMVQFFRGIPRSLDESASIDGCNSFMILVRILIPLCKPAIISAFVFQFIWTWNDFFNALIFVDSVHKYPIALGLRMSIDTGSGVAWNQILAMCVVSMVPCIALFFFSQKYLIEGVSTTGLKG